MTGSRRRDVALLATALFALVGLVSCTPEVNGLSGVTVDDEGQPLAVLTWCDKQPPTAVVIVVEEPRSQESPGTAVPSPSGPFAWPGRRYDVPNDVNTPIMVSLADFPGQVTGSEQSFRLWGVSDNNHSASRAVVFAVADLVELTPGSILVSSYARGGDLVQEQVSMDEFSQRGSELC